MLPQRAVLELHQKRDRAHIEVQVTSAPQSLAHHLSELSVRQRLGIQLE